MALIAKLYFEQKLRDISLHTIYISTPDLGSCNQFSPPYTGTGRGQATKSSATTSTRTRIPRRTRRRRSRTRPMGRRTGRSRRPNSPAEARLRRRRRWRATTATSRTRWSCRPRPFCRRSRGTLPCRTASPKIRRRPAASSRCWRPAGTAPEARTCRLSPWPGTAPSTSIAPKTLQVFAAHQCFGKLFFFADTKYFFIANDWQ